MNRSLYLISFVVLSSSHYVKWYCPKGELYAKIGSIPHHKCTRMPVVDCDQYKICQFTNTSIADQFNSRHFDVNRSHTVISDYYQNITFIYDMMLIDQIHEVSNTFATDYVTYVTTDTRFIIKNLYIRSDLFGLNASGSPFLLGDVYYDTETVYMLDEECNLIYVKTDPTFSLEDVETDYPYGNDCGNSDTDYLKFIKDHPSLLDNNFIDSYTNDVKYFTHQSNPDIENYIISFLGRISLIKNEQVKLWSHLDSNPLSDIGIRPIQIGKSFGRINIIGPLRWADAYGISILNLHEVTLNKLEVDMPIWPGGSTVLVPFKAIYTVDLRVRARSTYSVIKSLGGKPDKVVASAEYNLPIIKREIVIYGQVVGKYSSATGLTTFRSELSNVNVVDININFFMTGWPNLIVYDSGPTIPGEIYPFIRTITKPITDLLTDVLPDEYKRVLNLKLTSLPLDREILINPL